ncbi:MAG: C39 family peptidase [Bacilli bacterium]|nr:C39 family peptidase [Bacilli bacterium]
MNDFSFSEYGIFADGISTIHTLNEKWKQGQSELTTYSSKLADSSIFMGPACDSCIDGMKKSDSKVSTLVGNFSQIYQFLITSAEDYQKSDQDSKVTVLQSDEDGVQATTLEHTVVNGTPVYYNQNGYYDKDGNWKKWESSWGKDIASSGCGPTSMAAVLATMLGDTSITPSTVANLMDYNDNIGGNYVKKVADKYNLDQTHSIGLDKDKMNNFLRNNGKMIVAVNNGGHYISVLGINDSTNPPTYIVCDPNDSKTATKTWTYNDIAAGHTMVFHIAPPGKTVEECVKGKAVQV